MRTNFQERGWQGVALGDFGGGTCHRGRRVRGGTSQVGRQYLQFVQDFGEEGKLVSFEDFVGQLPSVGRVVDAVVVFFTVLMEVVVLQEQVLPRYKSDVTITEASYSKDVAGEAGVKSLFHFEDDILVATDKASQMQDTLVFRHRKDEGILKADQEGMFVQSGFMNTQVMVPGVPVVGVISGRDLSA